MEIIVCGVIIIIVAIAASVNSQREYEKKLINRINKEYNEELDRKMDSDDFESLKMYFNMTKDDSSYVDDDTCADLDFDLVYKKINNTNSSVGREYLYAMLRKLKFDRKPLEELSRLSDNFDNNEEARIQVSLSFAKLSYAKGFSVYSYLNKLLEFEVSNVIIQFIPAISIIISILILNFVRADIGIIMLVVSIAYSVISYYREKAKIDNYIQCVKWIAKMILCAKEITKNKYSFLDEYNDSINKIVNDTKSITKNLYLLMSGSGMSGSLVDVILDYLRIITHIDIIKFYNTTNLVKNNFDEIIRLYEILGFIESAIAVASFRHKCDYYSIPDFKENYDAIEVIDVYHPLVTEPVSNTINEDKCVLLTGSNASGKSTFLKTIAINAILSQTIYTSLSRKYHADFYHVVSSMSHKDNIIEKDSYYMVEIKALKRILDMAGNNNVRLLCFLDEVLRGTNTIERIAASTKILEAFCDSKAFVFAATHDVELTALLENKYRNYHFEEDFLNGDVHYSYRLKEGFATTRNAITLLEINGYSKSIVEQARKLAKTYENTGKWSC